MPTPAAARAKCVAGRLARNLARSLPRYLTPAGCQTPTRAATAPRTGVRPLQKTGVWHLRSQTPATLATPPTPTPPAPPATPALRWPRQLAAALAAALAATAAHAAGPIVVRDDQGRTVTLATAARRAITAAPHATELVYA